MRENFFRGLGGRLKTEGKRQISWFQNIVFIKGRGRNKVSQMAKDFASAFEAR
jgi:hypothetical protein